jgi:uncharacterized membrane protein YeaQ/YmgE (transglycosylase-associated protein family)
MAIIAWIVLGLQAGLIALAMLPGSDSDGIVVTALIGIAGAVIGGFSAETGGIRRAREVLRGALRSCGPWPDRPASRPAPTWARRSGVESILLLA